MTQKKPLSELYQLYSKGELPKKELAGKIFQYLLDNFGCYRIFGGNRDRWDEFLGWLYPRIDKAIDRYRDLGSSFDAYIAGLVHSASKEYRYREVDHYMVEHMCWQARAEEMRLFESEPAYLETQKSVSIPKDIKPRHILFLLLKSYYFVSDEFVKQVAETIGMEPCKVQSMIDELRGLRSKQEAEIREFQERVYCQYYRYLTYQKKMKKIQPGTEYYERMKNRFERARKRFDKMKKRLEGMRIGPSNRMIAAVMGIPKGTVDSGLFAIKNRLASGTGAA